MKKPLTNTIKIFISYSRRDKEIADYIAAHLRSRGADIFVDYQKLIGGENFINRLGTEIINCDKFLILLSPRSVESGWVQAEVAWAFASKKTIIPVLIELTSMVNFFVLANLQQIDFSRWAIDGNVDEAINKLSDALGLPNKPTTTEIIPPLLTRTSDINEIDNEKLIEQGFITFARQDLSDLFLTAAEVATEDPEQAFFLYHQILDVEPDYMNGEIKEFVRHEEERLKPIRLERMTNSAQEFIESGKWRQAERIANDILMLDSEQISAKNIISIAQENARCEARYEHAIIAAQKDRWGAIPTILIDIQKSCPNYGDPSDLIGNWWDHQRKISDSIPVGIEWIDIPAGIVTINNKKYTVDDFQISKFPVTNSLYQSFIDDHLGYNIIRWWLFAQNAKEWRLNHPIPTKGRFPIGNRKPKESISWFDAVAFCQWVSCVNGTPITLPTEQQWQLAAQGNNSEKLYPWGNRFDKELCNTKESFLSKTSDVDAYTEGASAFGVFDMSGNVFEWCLNAYEEIDNTSLIPNISRVLRGGSWEDGLNNASCIYRSSSKPQSEDARIGFRLVSLRNRSNS